MYVLFAGIQKYWFKKRFFCSSILLSFSNYWDFSLCKHFPMCSATWPFMSSLQVRAGSSIREGAEPSTREYSTWPSEQHASQKKSILSLKPEANSDLSRGVQEREPLWTHYITREHRGVSAQDKALLPLEPEYPDLTQSQPQDRVVDKVHNWTAILYRLCGWQHSISGS